MLASSDFLINAATLSIVEQRLLYVYNIKLGEPSLFTAMLDNSVPHPKYGCLGYQALLAQPQGGLEFHNKIMRGQHRDCQFN